MNGKFRTLARRIHDEMPLLERVVARAQGAWSQSKLSSDDYYLDSVALNLDNFYSGLERLFELTEVCRWQPASGRQLASGTA